MATDHEWLTGVVREYDATMRALAPTVTLDTDWAPLERFVDVPAFSRTGTFLERQDWAAYLTTLTRWARSVDGFDTSVLRTSEVGPLVYYEIEERHHREAGTTVFRSLTVFGFTDAGLIDSLDVFMARAR